MSTDAALISRIQKFCMHDGPGLRTVVFFKGCPLRCAWCHNPETQSSKIEMMLTEKNCIGCGDCASVCPSGAQVFSPGRAIDRQKCVSCGRCAEVCPSGAISPSGERIPIEKIAEEVLADRAFYGTEGGITVSGGEPTFQPEALVRLLEIMRRNGVNTAVETCGAFPEDFADTLAGLVDLFLFDFKDSDPERLRRFTGADCERVANNLLRLDSLGCGSVVRCPLIPGVNLDADHAAAVAALCRRLERARFVELLPYHPYGESKAKRLGRTQRLFELPDEAALEDFAQSLLTSGVPVKLNGKLRRTP
ncbi:MAG: glycyl-radical enzyme activating protein [Clostridia bacterium]|nr:glycyl-radical enzyme activating protein [Clostridia bacterium]